MPKAEKVERVAELAKQIKASEALLLTEYRGLTVADITELRRALARDGTRFAVVKNTLMRRAASKASLGELEALLEGPTAVAFVAADAVAAAKTVVDASKRFPTLLIKGAYMDGAVLSAEDARALADLESREVMLSKVAGLLKGEMSRTASMFQSLPSQLVGLLEALRDKMPAPEEPLPAAEVAEPAAAEEPPAPEPEPEPVPDATTEPVDGSTSPSATADPADDPEGSNERTEE